VKFSGSEKLKITIPLRAGHFSTLLLLAAPLGKISCASLADSANSRLRHAGSFPDFFI